MRVRVSNVRNEKRREEKRREEEKGYCQIVIGGSRLVINIDMADRKSVV